MAGQPAPDFAGLLQQLRAEAGLTQEELGQAAGLSPRTVSDLERGVHRSAQQDTARLLAEALGLAGPVRGLFVAAARGRVPAAEVLAARSGLPRTVGGPPGHQADVERLLGAVIDSPYRGLDAFEEQDAGFFFGREAATTALLDRMSHQSRNAGLLVVSGASGSGKTSLLRAGVLPRIRQAGLAAAPAAASWPHLVLTPTRAPLDELALRMGLLAGADAAAVRRSLDAGPDGFTLTVRQAALAGDSTADPEGLSAGRDQQRLLLVVDQFEELFTLCADEVQRQAFIAVLHAAATGRHGPGRVPAAQVVLGLRADFEARCAGYPQLAGAVQGRHLVTALTGRQLRMALTEPAKKAGSALDADLVEVLLAEAHSGRPGESGAGVLPFITHALDQAWRRRTGLAVTLAEYERVGGIESVVADRAQRAYERLSGAAQAAARQVFTRLVAVSGDGVQAAGHVGKADLAGNENAAQARHVAEVLEAFTNERLLTLTADGVAISHEVVLAAWPLLRDTWLAGTQEDRIVRSRLHHTAAEWTRHSRDPSYLYGGSLLNTATGMAARVSADPARYPPLSQAERDFLAASDRARRHRRRRRRAFFAFLGAVAAGIGAVAVLAVHVIGDATRQPTIAFSQQLISLSYIDHANPDLARMLSVEAWQLHHSQAARNAMLFAAELPITLLLHTEPVAISPGGRLLASDDSGDSIWLSNMADGQPDGQPFTGDAGLVVSVTFRPHSNMLATGDSLGTVRLWDVRTHRATGHSMGGDLGVAESVAFNPRGNILAASGQDGTVLFWNAASQRDGRPITGHHGPILSVAYSPRRNILATGSRDGAVQLWNATSHRQIAVLKGHTGGVYSLAFSPDGNMLATGSADHTVLLWDLAVNEAVEHSLARASGPYLAHYLCARARAALTSAASAQYVRPNYPKACP